MPTDDVNDPSTLDEVDKGALLDQQVQGRDAGPIDEDAIAAADGLTATKETEEHYTEMVDKGAHQRGEGALS